MVVIQGTDSNSSVHEFGGGVLRQSEGILSKKPSSDWLPRRRKWLASDVNAGPDIVLLYSELYDLDICIAQSRDA